MTSTTVRTYGYRWVVLLAFMAVPLLVGLPLLGRAVRQPARWGAR